MGHNTCRRRTQEFQRRFADEDIDIALIHDSDNIFYLSAYRDYLSMQIGRPTILAIPSSGEPSIITPNLEAEMCKQMTWIGDTKEWADGVAGEWRDHLRAMLKSNTSLRVGVELFRMHPVIQHYLRAEFPEIELVDIFDILADMRMIKTPEEIDIMRQAGQVAVAMCEGGLSAIAEGVPEYEIALALIAGGTRKAAEFIPEEGMDRLFSPMIYNLPVLQSGGPDLSMVHRRASVRKVKRGESVYMCYCELTNFKGFKIGFDRQYWVGSVTDEEARLYEITLRAQQAALDTLRPGVTAEEVNTASENVYKEEGFGACYRTGRSIGYSLIENPQLKSGDKTVIQAGMTFAVDGAVSVEGVTGIRVGDSVVVTEKGFEYLTPYPKDLRVVD